MEWMPPNRPALNLRNRQPELLPELYLTVAMAQPV